MKKFLLIQDNIKILKLSKILVINKMILLEIQLQIKILRFNKTIN